MTWLTANWKEVLLIVLAIDAALVPVFPSVGLLASIQTLLKNLTTPAA